MHRIQIQHARHWTHKHTHTHTQVYDSQKRCKLIEEGYSREDALRMVPPGLKVVEAVTMGKTF